MKNVVFFIGSLQAGGTEAKLARNFLPHLKERGKIVPKLLLLQERGEFLDVLPEDIEKLTLNERADTNMVRIIPRLKDALLKLKADVVISCMWYPAIISHMTRKFGFANFKHVIHDTVNMTEYINDEFRSERYKLLKVFLFRRAYANADAVIVNSRGIKSDLVNNFKLPEGNLYTIYNPLNKEMIARMAAEESALAMDAPLVVSVGRLIYQKGFDTLLHAFRKVRNNCPAKLLILGIGGDKEKLISLVEALNLQTDVRFMGFHHNPFRFMKEATVFCLASRYEGFPNVVLEAMTLGVPTVVTDCPSGPSEILDKGKYGILVPPDNPDALADALIRVLRDKELRKTLSELSLKRSMDFGFDSSFEAYENIIMNG